ncbi:MAG: lysA [Rickettsiales bacterium]|jgi:diaminopimelate decarboxylase|nr:lysA [Rickettsiales bacterium]
MDHFQYKEGVLHAEDVSLASIADKVGTPFYCYSTATLLRHYRVFADAFKEVQATICFAIKANSNQAVLSTLAREGAGGDAVSEGEIRRALAAGIPPERIVFSGVGKTRDEMAYALKNKIGQFNIESEPELICLSEVASTLGVKANIAVRINPDVDAKTHKKISTGKKENKFGVDWEAARELYRKAGQLPGINVRGVSTHIGSQLLELAPFEAAFKRVEELVHLLRSDGHVITHLDLGGGLGIPYAGEEPPTPENYANMVIQATRHLGCHLVFEPGRLIAGNAGVLVSDVIYVKRTEHRNFLIVDAAMNDLIRPSLYDAYHEIVPLNSASQGKAHEVVDVVGPVCETGDVFAEQRDLPRMEAGDRIAFRSAGAYGAVMASTYNTRRLIPEVMVNEKDWAVVRPRETYDELIGRDQIPSWLENKHT